MGDEWAPTWGRGDVLYTANDDGTSFGGITKNTIAFGQLVGDSPDDLVGITVSEMASFRENMPGPKGAYWKSVESRAVGDKLYRLAACRSASPETCLFVSNDKGTHWDRKYAISTGARSLTPSFIEPSTPMKDGLDGGRGAFLYAAAYAATMNGVDEYVLFRAASDDHLRVSKSHWFYLDKQGNWKTLSANSRELRINSTLFANNSMLGADNANWKVTNSYSVDGILYMFITRCHYPWELLDPKLRHVWEDASIIKSMDGGKTWNPPSKYNLRHPMFPGHRFGAPYFVWYGKDGSGGANGGGKYVYAVSNDGYFEGGDNYVLGRVLKSKLSVLSGSDWQFYTGGDGLNDQNWSSSLSDAKPILANPGRSGMAGMTYIPSLQRYVLVSWYYSQGSFKIAINSRDLSTTIEFYDSPTPWGPWHMVKSVPTGKFGWYAPVVGQRFQQPTNDGKGVSAILYTTGFTSKPDGGLDFSFYKLNYLRVTFSTVPLQSAESRR
jgi:hypothetical protein